MSSVTVPVPYDMYHFWAAGAVARAGGNPYALSEIQRVMLEMGWPPEEMVFGFLHPFWSLWIFSFLSMFPLPAAKFVCEATIFLLGSLSVGLLVQPSVRRLLSINAPTPFLVFAALLFPPAMSTIYYGQVSVLSLLGITGWLVLSLRKDYFWAGVVLSLTTLKPQLFIPFYLWVFFSHLRRKEHTLVFGLVTGLLLQTSISLSISPHSAALWMEAMQHVSVSAMQLPTPSLGRLISLASGIEHIQLVLTVGAALLATVVAILDNGEPLQKAIMVYLPLSLLAAPYTWTHGFLALLPVQLVLLSRLQTCRPRTAHYGVLALGTLSIFELCIPRILSPYMVLLPLALIFFGAYQVRFLSAPQT